MSRAYRVNWVTASSTVTTSDTLTVGVSLLGILPEAEMAAMLRDELIGLLSTDDAREGLMAFMEKRAPQWTGK